MIDLASLTITKIQKALRNKDFSARELTEAYRASIATHNRELNAYLEVFDDAIQGAMDVDALISRGEELPPLAGVPIAMKDIILIKGHIASAASKILENHRAVYDATVTEKLKAQHALFLGRTNMDEFAHGASGENSAYGPARNPHDPTRVPGGSSSGSAVAVAAHMAAAALGTDTGGSVRLPASFCGLVGLRTTYGAISRYGIIAMGSSLDQVGPITKTVTDAEILFTALRGLDRRDATSHEYEAKRRRLDRTKLRIGIPRAFLGKGIEADVLVRFTEAVQKFKNLGHEIVDIDLPHIGYALAVYYIIMPAEVSTNLARFDGMRYGLHEEGNTLLEEYMKSRGKGFGPEAKRRIMLGTYVLSHGYYDAYYNKAVAVRNIIQQEMEEVFMDKTGVDAFLTPTGISPAFKIGEKSDDPLAMYLQDIFTVSANIAGVPAISIPMGTVDREGKNLPVGLQITAPYFAEDTLFCLGKQFLGEAVY